MLKDIEWLFFDVGSTLISEEKAYEHRMRDMAGQQMAKDVACELKFEYNYDEECAGIEFLKLVRELPKDAEEIC